MVHAVYTGKIKNYIDGIEQDLGNVTANAGHELIKVSIMEQAKRLADIATHNNDFLIDFMDEFLTMLEQRYNVVDFNRENVVLHEQLMKEFNVYLKWGLDAVDHFDKLTVAHS